MMPRCAARFGASWTAIAAVALLLAGGCSEVLRVLGPTADAGGDAGGGDAAVAVEGDARIDEPPDASVVPGCGACAALQVCALERCVDVSGVRSLATHFQHTCLVLDGRLFCTGKNAAGQLGVGDRASRELPKRVGVDGDWLRVAVGEGHSCGLRAPGTLHCWGDNSLGQLGLGDTEPRLEPAKVGAFDDWTTVACGGANCCALRDSGTLYCWGDNLEGKPAQDDPYGEPDVLEPRAVAIDARFAELALGQGHVNAIGVDGALYGWGRNIAGETGTAPGVQQLRVPTRVGSGADWVAVAAAQHHSCGARADGTLWCWGQITHGELGLPPVPDGGDKVLEPTLVGGIDEVVSVGAGWFHTCALTRAGALYCVGRAIEGQLAQPAGDPIGSLTFVDGVDGFAQVSLGHFHTCAVGADGTPYCWGENTYGQLGVGDVERRYMPAALVLP